LAVPMGFLLAPARPASGGFTVGAMLVGLAPVAELIYPGSGHKDF
jgi:hypothetical protein